MQYPCNKRERIIIDEIFIFLLRQVFCVILAKRKQSVSSINPMLRHCSFDLACSFAEVSDCKNRKHKNINFLFVFRLYGKNDTSFT